MKIKYKDQTIEGYLIEYVSASFLIFFIKAKQFENNYSSERLFEILKECDVKTL